MRGLTAVAFLLAAVLAATASAETLEEVLARSADAYARHQLDEAVAILEARLKAPEPDENLVPLHGALGDLYLEMANVDKALEHYDWIAAEHPNYSRVHFERGRALEHAGRFKEAIDAYSLAGEKGYDEAEVRGRIGFNYVLLANSAETPDAERQHHAEIARKSLTRAVELDPRNYAAMGNLADILYNLGEFESALGYYERMEKLEPSRPMTLARIGNVYSHLGQCEPAIENLLRAADLLKGSKPRAQAETSVDRDIEAFSRVHAAECLIALERPSEARSEIDRVLELANCPDCVSTSAQLARSKLRAEALRSQLDAATPANAKTTP